MDQDQAGIIIIERMMINHLVFGLSIISSAALIYLAPGFHDDADCSFPG